MSGVEANEFKELEHRENAHREEDGGNLLEEPEHQDNSLENSMPSSQEEVGLILVNCNIWMANYSLVASSSLSLSLSSKPNSN